MAQMPQEVEGIAVYHQLCRQDAEVAAKQCRVHESRDGLDSSVDVAVDVLDIQVSNLGIVHRLTFDLGVIEDSSASDGA